MAEQGEMPQVSIVVSNYNGMMILPSCLNSIENQTFTDYEAIVVDDASTDASVKIVESNFPWVKLVTHPRNQGHVITRKTGYAEAAGEFVLFLDNDVTLDDRCLEELVSAMRSDVEIGIAAPKLLFRDNPSVVNSVGGFINLAGYGWDHGIYEFDGHVGGVQENVLFACGAAWMVRRSIFEAVGGFKDVCPFGFEDVDVGWKVNLAGYRVRCHTPAVAFHSLGATMGKYGTRKVYLYERARFYTLIKNFEPETLRTIRGDLWRLHLDVMHSTLTYRGCSRAQSLLRCMNLVSVAISNLFGLPKTLGLRKEISRIRKRSDLELIKDSLIKTRFELPANLPNPYLQDYQPRRPEDIPNSKMSRLNMYDGCADFLGTGWNNREFTMDYETFRWTKDEAIAYLVPGRRPRNLTLKVVAAHPVVGSHGRVILNGEVVKEFFVLNRHEIIRAPIPESEGSDVFEVKIVVDNPFVPDDEYGNRDRRRLGIGISKLELSP